MTSKISFSKMTWDELRKLSWLTAAQALVFGLLIPFRVLIMLASMRSYDRAPSSADLLEELCTQIGLGHMENTCFILMAGAVCALCAFGYVHSQVKLDFFHSLAVKRERLFAAKYLGSTLTFVIAYGASQFFGLVVGACYGAMSVRVVLEVAAASVQGLLFFLCSYSGTLLAVMLTGKMLTTVFAVCVLGGYVPLLWLLQLLFRELFFAAGMREYVLEQSNEILNCSSPWAFCLGQQAGQNGLRGLTGVWPKISDLCQLVAVAVLFTAISLLLYRIRRTEAAGRALVFRQTEGIVKILLAVPGALLAAFAANEIFSSVVWEVIFIVIFGGLCCMVMEFIYRGDIRQSFGQKKHIVVTVLLASLVFFLCRFDVFGYNTWLPDQDQIASMAVRDNAMAFAYDDEKYLRYGTVSKTLLDKLETEKIEPIYRIAESGVENEKNGYYLGDVRFVYLKYRLKNGKEVYRNYWVAKDVYQECMDELMRDDSFRESYFPILTWDGTNDCYSVEGSVPEAWLKKGAEEAADIVVEIPSQMIERLIEAYRRDLAKVSYSELLEAEGYVWFNYRYKSSDTYPITDQFNETLALLQQCYDEYNDGESDGVPTEMLD